MINNYYKDPRGPVVFFDDTKPLPPIPVGAVVWKPIRHRPDIDHLIGEYCQDEVIECATE